MSCAVSLNKYYSIPPDLRDLNYEKFIDHGNPAISNAIEYNSHNTDRLGVQEVANLLKKIGLDSMCGNIKDLKWLVD